MVRYFAAIALSVFAVSVHSQTALPGHASSIVNLVGAINSLTERVSKLEGNITAADLVGTYSVNGFQTELFDSGNPNSCCHVSTYVFKGTATLHADNTFEFVSTGDHGTTLHLEHAPFFHAQVNNDGGSLTGTWAYSGGTLTIEADGPVTLDVAAGGRLLVHAGANQSDGTTVLLLLVRMN